MRLHELLQKSNISADAFDAADIEITAVADDSRRVMPGDLFIARPGQTADGAAFAKDAVARGAVAIAAQQPLEDVGVPVVIVDDAARAASLLANAIAGDPSRGMRVLAVTGTNGKTTTAYLVRHILNHVGQTCGMIGTVEIDDGKSRSEATLTTPGAVETAGLLAKMKANGCRACAIEASSHALDQSRLAGVHIAAAAFTNLTLDHLDYHKTMDAYAAAKARLFTQLPPDGVAVVNADDPAHERMIETCQARVITFAARGEADYRAVDVAATAAGTSFILKAPDGQAEFHLKLIGRHNIENALAAIALCCESAGVSVHQAAAALATADGAPGRLQAVRGGQPFAVIVDYAHTDDALANVLTALRPLTRGRLRVVFGCGGDRDKTKRPRMAAVAQRHADLVYVTSDNPRTEAPQAIINDITAGFAGAPAHGIVVQPDRRRAIQQAIANAQPGDVVLIAGKGHENYQIVSTTKQHFDDVEEAIWRSLPRRRCSNFDEAYLAASLATRSARQPRKTLNVDRPQPKLMSPLTAQQIANATGGTIVAGDGDTTITRVSTDSRVAAADSLFIAIVGDTFDPHDKLREAITNGARVLLVQRWPLEGAGDAAVVLVDDTRRAMGRLATHVRRQLRGAVIAIGGSNGKTGTKHLLGSVLKTQLTGSMSPKSFNNDIGVPLTLFAAEPDDDYVIVEIGTNHPGEVRHLSLMCEPDIAIITSIGEEHMEFFGTLDAVRRENADIIAGLRPGGHVLICGDDEPLRELLPGAMTFGFDSDNDLHASDWDATLDGVWFRAVASSAASLESDAEQFFVPQVGKHNATNALAAIAVARLLGLSDERIRIGLTSAFAPEMRMQKRVFGDVTILNDAYNANPTSMSAAVEFLAGLVWKGTKIAVLGEMRELGAASPEAHRDIIEYIAQGTDITRLCLIGEVYLPFCAEFGATVVRLDREPTEEERDDFDKARQEMRHGPVIYYAPTVPSALISIALLVQSGDLVLLKASRGVKLERVQEAIRDFCSAAQPGSGPQLEGSH